MSREGNVDTSSKFRDFLAKRGLRFEVIGIPITSSFMIPPEENIRENRSEDETRICSLNDFSKKQTFHQQNEKTLKIFLHKRLITNIKLTWWRYRESIFLICGMFVMTHKWKAIKCVT